MSGKLFRKISWLVMLCFAMTVKVNAQAYFQQQVDYDIEVQLDDVNHSLFGWERMTYYNFSPDTLHKIYIHLWPNAYSSDTTDLAKQLLSKGETGLFYAEPNERGSIGALDFKVNGKQVKWNYSAGTNEIAEIPLSEPLLPEKHVHIETPFKVKLPDARFSRLGHVGQSYMITQWYPKPAVYDRNGWHTMPYLNQGEFYSEFGHFNVSITLPNNYVVGATGDLQNSKEIAFLDSLDQVTRDIETFDISMDFPPSAAKGKTLRYQAQNVHDFAWFADKRYHVLQRDVTIPETGDSVRIHLMFTDNEPHLWNKALDYAEDALLKYSKWVGPYPYHELTVVDGTISAGSGMEYPNITVIGTSSTDFALESVIMHEIGHNWFYGMLGSNERNHPWMDEGMNSYIECRYLEEKYPSAGVFGTGGTSALANLIGLDEWSHTSSYELFYLTQARLNIDQPIDAPAADYTDMNYGSIVYSKSVVAFRHLEAYLGRAKMDEIFRAYFDQWQYKHPYPEDFEAVCKEHTSKNLDWFFGDFLKSRKKVDYGIGRIVRGEQQKLEIINKGGISAPVIIHMKTQDLGWSEMIIDGFEGSRYIVVPSGTDSVIIDRNHRMMEVDRRNNQIALNRPFKRIEPLQLQFMASLDPYDKTPLHYLPVVGWNGNDRWMPGVALYGNLLPSRKWQYYALPMFSTQRKQLAGALEVRNTQFPGKSKLTSGVAVKHYGLSGENDASYLKGKPYLRWTPQNLVADDGIVQSIELSSTILNYSVQQEWTGFEGLLQMRYQAQKDHAIFPWEADCSWINGEGFGQVNTQFSIEMITREDGKKKVSARIFAGGFLYNRTNNPLINYRMDGQYGLRDFTYDHHFIDRTATDGIWSRQLTSTHGFFKVPTPLGQSNKWIVAMNVEADLPIPLPISGFADIGTSAGAIDFTEQWLLFDAGLAVTLIPDVCKVYFPLIISPAIQDALGNENVVDRIRFTFELEKFSFFSALDKVW